MFEFSSAKFVRKMKKHDLMEDAKGNTALWCWSDRNSGLVGVSWQDLCSYHENKTLVGDKNVHVENPNARRTAGMVSLDTFLAVEREWIGKEGDQYCLVDPADMKRFIVPDKKRSTMTPPDGDEPVINERLVFPRFTPILELPEWKSFHDNPGTNVLQSRLLRKNSNQALIIVGDKIALVERQDVANFLGE
jgi:hypothetical protein